MTRRQDAATATVGLAGVSSAAMLRHRALADAHGEGTAHAVPRARLGAERRFLRTRAGRGKYLLGAGLAFASVPAAATGTSRLVNKADEHQRSFVGEGLRGARRAATQRTRTMRERPPAKLTAANYAVGAGATAAAGGLTHLGLRRLPGTPRAGIAAVTGALAGVASLPMQTRATQHATRGRYEVTPVGVRRRRTKPLPASSKAGIQKRTDFGAGMSRGERRARITAAGPPIPVVGDLMQASMAGRLAHPSNRRRAAVSQYGANQVGGAAGTAVGAVGAAALADRSAAFRRRATSTNERIDSMKRRVNIDPNKPGMASRALANEHTPGGVRRGVQVAARSRVGRMVGRNKPAAAVGGLVLGALGGQASSQTAITRQLNHDDALRRNRNTQARHGTRVHKAQPPLPTPRERKELSRRKEISAAGSVFTGTTGLAALGATLGEKALRHRRPRLAGRLGKVPVPALTIGAGVGGLNAYNYADIQHREAKQAVRKAMPWDKASWIRLGKDGRLMRLTPTHQTSQRAYRQLDQGLHDLRQKHRMTVNRPRLAGGPVREEWWTAAPRQTFGKGFPGMTLSATGRRAPGIRRGFVRQTRTATGIKVSTVRGGLIR